MFLKGDTFSRRDYVFIYTANILAATVKGRYKRVWVGEKPGLSGAAFFDLYTDPREENPKMVPMFPAKGMFNIIKLRHQLWMAKYPNTRTPAIFRSPASRTRARKPMPQGSRAWIPRNSRSIRATSLRAYRVGTAPSSIRMSEEQQNTA